MYPALVIVFVTGYLLIALESYIKINKSATALLTGVVCWIVYTFYSGNTGSIITELSHHLSDISGILFFLLCAMAIVELIDAHDGFEIITSRINITNKAKLLWIISFLAFALSALLDNLTTTIVIISFLRKIIKSDQERMLYSGMTVIAANAGGAWSPIGDVTTTMLWMGGQVTTLKLVTGLIFPCIICLVAPLTVASFRMKGNIQNPEAGIINTTFVRKREQVIVLVSGILILLFVPIFKMLTGLPPFMGILFGLGILWMITELIHGRKKTEDYKSLSVANALQKIDSPGILFFLGILLAVAALQSSGILVNLAEWTISKISNIYAIVISIGLLSAIVDNVPLVAAVQGMFSLHDFPTDHTLWEFLAYTTGTGGSILVIGSASGIVAMGMDNLNFFWYLRKISLHALIGFFAGAIWFILQRSLF